MIAEKNISGQFKSFVDREYALLIQYVKVRLNERYYNEYAEDIVQDVALNIYSKLDLNIAVENLAGYFYRSLHNRIIDLKRKNKKRIFVEDYRYEDSGENTLLRKYAEDNNNQTDNADQEEKDAQLMNAIDQLPSEQREVIIAIEFEGMSYDQLSKKLKIPVGTLLSRKHRGVAQLAKMMNPKKQSDPSLVSPIQTQTKNN